MLFVAVLLCDFYANCADIMQIVLFLCKLWGFYANSAVLMQIVLFWCKLSHLSQFTLFCRKWHFCRKIRALAGTFGSAIRRRLLLMMSASETPPSSLWMSWTLGCFSKDTLKKNKMSTPPHNWGVPRKIISRRRGWSNKSRGLALALKVWPFLKGMRGWWGEQEVSGRWAGDEREVSSSWSSRTPPLHHTPSPSSNAQPLKTWPWSLQSNMLKKILPKVQQTQTVAGENWQKMAKL